MRPLSAQLLIDVWERGEGREPQLQAEELLAATQTQVSREKLQALSLGQRDTLLLRLREATLGPSLQGYVKCPQCSASLDFSLEIEQLFQEVPERAGAEHFAMDELVIRYRLPTAADLTAASACPTLEEARALLLDACVLEASRGGIAIAASKLTEAEIDAFGERIEAADPQAELPLAMACAVCGYEWLPLLDIASFFWAEVSALAERLMGEVVTLARNFGWSEREILSMSAARRQRYLELSAG